MKMVKSAVRGAALKIFEVLPDPRGHLHIYFINIMAPLNRLGYFLRTIDLYR